MENPEFEWDDDKAVGNLKKHSVSFDEGATIFNDPMMPRSSILTIRRKKNDMSLLGFR